MEVTGKLVAKKESDGGVSYNLSSLSVKGSPLSTRYDSLLSARTYLDSLYALNARKFAAFDSLMMAAYKSKDQAKIKELRQSADGKPGLKLIKSFWYCRFTVSSGSHGKQGFILGAIDDDFVYQLFE